MIDVPSIIYGPWENGNDGRMYYTVQYSGQDDYQEILVDAYDYLVASANAVDKLDEQLSSSPFSEPVSDIPVNHVHSGLPEYVSSPESSDEVPFEGSLTAYDDRAPDAPALYANLPVVSNSFTNIMDWFGDTFFIERTETVHKSGYTSERYSYNSSSQLIQLPYEEDSTVTSQVLNPQACVSAVLVVLVFITTVTWIKNAIWGRMS